MITVAYTHKPANYSKQYYVCQGAHGAGYKGQTWAVKSGTCPTRRIRREILEPMLDELIATRLGNPKFLDKVIAAQAEEDHSGTAEQMDRLKLEIEEAERAIERTQEMYARGKIDQGKFDRLEGQLQLELRAARVALEKTRPNLARITPEMWRPIALQFKRWLKLDQSKKRVLLSSLAQVFEVAGYTGPKGWRDTVVAVKGLRLNLSGSREDSSAEISVDAEDALGRSGLVPIASRSYSGLDRNQSAMYFPL